MSGQAGNGHRQGRQVVPDPHLTGHLGNSTGPPPTATPTQPQFQPGNQSSAGASQPPLIGTPLHNNAQNQTQGINVQGMHSTFTPTHGSHAAAMTPKTPTRGPPMHPAQGNIIRPMLRSRPAPYTPQTGGAQAPTASSNRQSATYEIIPSKPSRRREAKRDVSTLLRPWFHARGSSNLNDSALKKHLQRPSPLPSRAIIAAAISDDPEKRCETITEACPSMAPWESITTASCFPKSQVPPDQRLLERFLAPAKNLRINTSILPKNSTIFTPLELVALGYRSTSQAEAENGLARITAERHYNLRPGISPTLDYEVELGVKPRKTETAPKRIVLAQKHAPVGGEPVSQRTHASQTAFASSGNLVPNRENSSLGQTVQNRANKSPGQRQRRRVGGSRNLNRSTARISPRARRTSLGSNEVIVIDDDDDVVVQSTFPNANQQGVVASRQQHPSPINPNSSPLTRPDVRFRNVYQRRTEDSESIVEPNLRDTNPIQPAQNGEDPEVIDLVDPEFPETEGPGEHSVTLDETKEEAHGFVEVGKKEELETVVHQPQGPEESTEPKSQPDMKDLVTRMQSFQREREAKSLKVVDHGLGLNASSEAIPVMNEAFERQKRRAKQKEQKQKQAEAARERNRKLNIKRREQNMRAMRRKRKLAGKRDDDDYHIDLTGDTVEVDGQEPASQPGPKRQRLRNMPQNPDETIGEQVSSPSGVDARDRRGTGGPQMEQTSFRRMSNSPRSGRQDGRQDRRHSDPRGGNPSLYQGQSRQHDGASLVNQSPPSGWQDRGPSDVRNGGSHGYHRQGGPGRVNQPPPTEWQDGRPSNARNGDTHWHHRQGGFAQGRNQGRPSQHGQASNMNNNSSYRDFSQNEHRNMYSGPNQADVPPERRPRLRSFEFEEKRRSLYEQIRGRMSDLTAQDRRMIDAFLDNQIDMFPREQDVMEFRLQLRNRRLTKLIIYKNTGKWSVVEVLVSAPI